jgi:hypothetical protein
LSNFDRRWVDEIVRRLDSLEGRIWKLEEALLGVKKPSRIPKQTSAKSGGVLVTALDELIKDGIFDQPKTFQEIQKEFERRGHYFKPATIYPCLTRDFMKKRRILTRVGKKGEWRYVLKK